MSLASPSGSGRPPPPAQDRVLTRLAVTSDDALETVVGRLLPLLLPQLAVEAPPVRNKVRPRKRESNGTVLSVVSIPIL